ncbi:MAG: DUF3343 domain-containing protein [Firmicutes bacterium]|nr:DUF3343 domain-containing protein [Bacillota bacterium]
MYYIFSFRSRNQSIGFFEAVTREGVGAKIINTPRAISIGCGLSVKVNVSDIDRASELLDQFSCDTFLGLFYYNGAELTRVRN